MDIFDHHISSYTLIALIKQYLQIGTDGRTDGRTDERVRCPSAVYIILNSYTVLLYNLLYTDSIAHIHQPKQP